MGCLAAFFAEEDWAHLKTFQDASSMLVGYCAEDHEKLFCDSLGPLVFSSVSDAMQSQLQPSPVLCAELESVQRAEEAWLHGQQAALQQRSVMPSDLGAVSSADG